MEPLRVLLVEDDPDFAALFRHYLRRIPGTLLEAVASLDAALERLPRGDIDLIVTDLGLPDSAGLATLAKLSGLTDRPIIVLTGLEHPALRAAALDAGAYEFVHKSEFGPALLARLVRLAQKQAETFRSLRDSEARFRSLTQLSSDWYWEQDQEARITRFEGELVRTLAVDRASLIGRRRWEIERTRALSCSWEEHRAVLAARQVFRDLELARVDDNGELHYISVSGEPFYDVHGAFSGYRGVATDITRRKREGEKLARLGRMYAALSAVGEAISKARSEDELLAAACQIAVESGTFLLAVIRQVDAASGWTRVVAASGPDPAGLTAHPVSVDEGRPEGRGLVGIAYRTKKPAIARDLFDDARTSAWATRAAATPVKSSGAFPLLRDDVCIGILVLHGAEQASFDGEMRVLIERMAGSIAAALETLEHEVRFRQTFELAASGIAHVDLSGRFMNVNRALCELLGYTREELIGMSVKDISHGEDRDLTDEQRLRVRRGEDASARFEKRYVREDGRVVWVDLTVALARRTDGTPLYEISIVEDITPRKEAEARRAAHLRYQEKIARFGQAALAKRDAGALVAEAVQAALEGLQAEAVAYVEPGGEDGSLVLRALVGQAVSEAMMAPCAAGDAIGTVLRGGEGIVIDGLHNAATPLPFQWAMALPSALLRPVRGEKRVYGALCALAKGYAAFGDEEANFLAAAASVLSAGLQRIESETRLAFLAQFDGLTRLPNRALLSDRFSQAIVQAQRRGGGLGVLFIDLDEFKLVNDTLGHAAGDELLQEAARRLQAALRGGDTVARISGDEFAVLLGELARPDDAGLVAEKVIRTLAAPYNVREKELFVTASIGIATYPADGTDAEALLAAADAAMYRAKQSGRNSFHFFTAEINQRTRARAQLGTELRRALDRAEFALHYQPKYDLKSRNICGAEALLRWTHPGRGVVPPVEFIPVLEETGLIGRVGEWALQQACRDVRRWLDAGLCAPPVAVNLSPRQFRQPGLDVQVCQALAMANIPPGLLILEITESQLMHDPEQAARTMAVLRAAGIAIALDDFGTGYSSLAHLTRFPLAALKIDRSFVREMLNDRNHATIVHTIVSMAHTLGFTVVAEGIETEEQANHLTRIGCEQGQGYLFARPMPSQQFEALIARTTNRPASGSKRLSSVCSHADADSRPAHQPEKASPKKAKRKRWRLR